MSFACYLYALIFCLYVFVCHSYVSRMYSYVICMSLVCTRMSSVCHSYVIRMSLVCTRMSFVCTRMSSVCTPMYSYVIRSYAPVCHSYITPIWFCHEPLRFYHEPLKNDIFQRIHYHIIFSLVLKKCYFKMRVQPPLLSLYRVKLFQKLQEFLLSSLFLYMSINYSFSFVKNRQN